MRLRYLLSIALAAACALPLSAGCTHDFDQFLSGGGGAGCNADEKTCGDACVSRTDPLYGCGDGCAACALPNAVAICSGGACDVDACASGFTDCDGDGANGCEAATSNDPNNCGGCGTACVAANATPLCNSGVCELGPCGSGFADCDGNPANGCEAALATDQANCGGCGTACNPFQTCQASLCVLICPAGTADCNASDGDGCETTLGTPSDCAACGDACALAHATSDCDMGACVLATCDGGFDNCDNIAANGCEADLNASPTTCGDCNTACPSGPNSTAVCAGGTCGLVCMGTFADCDGDPLNGCEINTATDATHCGACFRTCSNANVQMASCAAGVCNSACILGFGNCATPAAPAPDDGCETSTSANVNNCGACGRACASSNVASKSCTNGLCDSTCDLGFANCSQPAGAALDNGCELNVQTNDSDCGGCGNSCSLQSPGFDCDRPGGGPAGQKHCGCSNNGECDTDGGGPAQGSCTSSTGLCSCNATQCAIGEGCRNVGGVNECTCNGGPTCGPGVACCQTPAGCFDLQSDPLSCGACGRACPPDFACVGGTCACDSDADCNAGTGGTFTCTPATGLCVCNGVTCAGGERCQPNGQCG